MHALGLLSFVGVLDLLRPGRGLVEIVGYEIVVVGDMGCKVRERLKKSGLYLQVGRP
jgi:hypothetical protein